MPAAANDSAKQRLLDLKVGEISLVDRPANEAEFLIIKRLEEQQMATAATEDKPNPEAGATPADETQDAKTPAETSEQPETDEASVAKAITQLSAALEKAGKAKAEMTPELKGDLMKLMEMVQGMLDKYPSPTEKSAAEPVAPVSIQLNDDGSLVVKGLKQLGKERMSKIKDALSQLLGVVKEANADVFAELLMGIDPVMFENEAKRRQGAKPPADGGEYPYQEAMGKTIEGLAKKVDDILTAQAAVSKRIDNLDKAGAVSKSVPTDGNDGAKPTKSFWNGVL